MIIQNARRLQFWVVVPNIDSEELIIGVGFWIVAKIIEFLDIGKKFPLIY
jgi:hypothetical protein